MTDHTLNHAGNPTQVHHTPKPLSPSFERNPRALRVPSGSIVSGNNPGVSGDHWAGPHGLPKKLETRRSTSVSMPKRIMGRPYLSRNMCSFDTDRGFSANFDRQASTTDSVLFLGLSPPKANKTVSFFVSFHRGATQSGILFLVSIERGGSRRVYDRVVLCCLT